MYIVVILMKQCMQQSSSLTAIVFMCRAEKLASEEKYEMVRRQLTEQTAEVSKLKEQCSELQLRLSQSSSDKEEKFTAIEQECSDRKMEIHLLQADMRSVNSNNELLQNQVHFSHTL